MRKNDSIKIQINSEEALNRLLGDDFKLDIEVRNNIIQRFAERHLKALANSQMIKALEGKLHDLIWSSGYNRKLNPEFEKRVQEEAEKLFKTKLQRDFNNLKAKHETLMNDKYNEFVENFAEGITSSLQRESMEKLINAKVNSKINRMLKLMNTADDAEQTVDSIDNLK